jgi:hypothetical protein
MASFEKQIDDDAIARNMISDVSQKAATRYGIALERYFAKQIDAISAYIAAAVEGHDSSGSRERD